MCIGSAQSETGGGGGGGHKMLQHTTYTLTQCHAHSTHTYTAHTIIHVHNTVVRGSLRIEPVMVTGSAEPI